MDKFLLKADKKSNISTPVPAAKQEKSKRSHLPVNITVKERANKYPKGTFFVDDNLMFCSTCNIVVDHLRKSVVDKHLQSDAHKNNANRIHRNSKQQTLRTSLNSRTPAEAEKVKVCQEWIRVCAASNIPLNMSDNPLLRKFLSSRAINGGAIPKASQLRDYYLFDVYQMENEELKGLVKDKQVALIVDELGDDEGRYVLDVMAVFLDFDELSPDGNTIAWLLDTHFLNETNNKTVSKAVLKTVHDYCIDFDNVRIFNSDNVGYMKKAFRDTLSCIFPNCIHITCHSHIVNLVANDFKKHFKEANEFVKCFRNLFYVASGRKSRYMKFLQKVKNEPSVKETMPPNPKSKSWKAWFDSVLYHADRYFLYEDFIKAELDRGRATACSSLTRLEEMYQDESFMKNLHAQLAFLKVKTPTLMAYLDYFQKNVPVVTQAYTNMEHLLHYLDQNCTIEENDLSAVCFDSFELSFSSHEKEELIGVFTSAFNDAHSKLRKYVVDGAQPASEFLAQVRFLDPTNLVTLSYDMSDIDSVPGFEAVPEDEWNLYVKQVGPAAVKACTGEFDLVLFWKSSSSILPELYKLASCYATATVGSYEVERSFSAYNEILDDKRRCLSESTIKSLHFLNWTLKIKSLVDQEREEQLNSVVANQSTSKVKKESKVNKNQGSANVRSTPHVNFNTVQEKKEVFNKVQDCTSKETTKDKKESKKETTCKVKKEYESNKNQGKPKVYDSPDANPNKIPRKQDVINTISEQNEESDIQKVKTARKRKKMTMGNGNIPKKKKKKPSNLSGGKLFRSSLKNVFSQTTKASNNTGDDSPNVSQDVRPEVHYGLDSNTAAKFHKETTCVLPEYKKPLLNGLLEGDVNFKGSSRIDKKDLTALVGGHPQDEENYLTNFVIDEYLNVLVTKSIEEGLKVETIEWEKFEKGIGKRPAKEVLKGKAAILNQDMVMVPCNPGNTRHWFLLVTLPVEKIIAIDSLAASFTKPTIKLSIHKMWNLLKELDKSLDIEQWCFCCNSPQDIPQQKNGFDCGVYTCLYARCLLQQSPMVSSDCIQSFRKQMILELNEEKLQEFSEPDIIEGQYYAVEYHKSFYLGRVLEKEGNTLVKFKFLQTHYTVGTPRLYEWPRRDDIDTCHTPCVFYGPCRIVGAGPFMIPQLREIEQVYQYLKKNRKRH